MNISAGDNQCFGSIIDLYGTGYKKTVSELYAKKSRLKDLSVNWPMFFCSFLHFVMNLNLDPDPNNNTKKCGSEALFWNNSHFTPWHQLNTRQQTDLAAGPPRWSLAVRWPTAPSAPHSRRSPATGALGPTLHRISPATKTTTSISGQIWRTIYKARNIGMISKLSKKTL